jgi:CO/xanthine dehydrogenase FAD-binding subunit
MVVGLINSPDVYNARPTRATIQVALFPVADDPVRRIRELEDALAQSEASYDKLVGEAQADAAKVRELTHQVHTMSLQIAYMRATYVPRCVVDCLNPIAVVRGRT